MKLRRALRAIRHPRRSLAAQQLRRELVSRYLGDARTLARYEGEVRASGLIPHLRERARQHAEAARDGYSLGAITYVEGMYLYAVLRTLRPHVAVETGVANGFSTAFALLALQENGDGMLHSIDLPREIGREYDGGTFYEGEGRAGIPPGSGSGWLIPEHLKERWRLIDGRSQDELPPLLERLGTIDYFMHDSEHSFDCMWFEFNAAWPRLREGGLLVSDDVNSTEAFPRFAAEQGQRPIQLGKGLAFLTR